MGLVEGPRIVATNMVVCMTGGHAAWIGRQADGADEHAHLQLRHRPGIARETGRDIGEGRQPGEAGVAIANVDVIAI